LKGRGFQELRKLWLDQLAHERRASPHTLRAYGDDAARFGGFLVHHLGGTVGTAALAKLAPADIRAFITHRRAEGLGPGGVQRALAAIRSFYRFLAREGILENAAPQGVRSPRLPRRLPRPLSKDDAAQALVLAADHDIAWIGKRARSLPSTSITTFAPSFLSHAPSVVTYRVLSWRRTDQFSSWASNQVLTDACRPSTRG